MRVVNVRPFGGSLGGGGKTAGGMVRLKGGVVRSAERSESGRGADVVCERIGVAFRGWAWGVGWLSGQGVGRRVGRRGATVAGVLSGRWGVGVSGERARRARCVSAIGIGIGHLGGEWGHFGAFWRIWAHFGGVLGGCEGDGVSGASGSV